MYNAEEVSDMTPVSCKINWMSTVCSTGQRTTEPSGGRGGVSRFPGFNFKGSASRDGNTPQRRTSEGHLEAVVVVHHGGDAIIAVPVKLVLIHPPPCVAHEKAQCLPVPCKQVLILPLGKEMGLQIAMDSSNTPSSPTPCVSDQKTQGLPLANIPRLMPPSITLPSHTAITH